MHVRYARDGDDDRRGSPSPFPIDHRHQTLLRMDDGDRSALHVEVSFIDSVGVHIVFTDYHLGDAPVLLINCLTNQSIVFGQEEQP